MDYCAIYILALLLLVVGTSSTKYQYDTPIYSTVNKAVSAGWPAAQQLLLLTPRGEAVKEGWSNHHNGINGVRHVVDSSKSVISQYPVHKHGPWLQSRYCKYSSPSCTAVVTPVLALMDAFVARGVQHPIRTALAIRSSNLLLGFCLTVPSITAPFSC